MQFNDNGWCGCLTLEEGIDFGDAIQGEHVHTNHSGCTICDFEPLCEEGEFALFAHYPRYAGEASWTATVNGTKICAAEYPSNGWFGEQELHYTGCCLSPDTGLVAAAIWLPITRR